MTLSPSIPLFLGLIAQAPAADAPKDERAARLDFMKTSLATYDVRRSSDPKPLRLLPEPVLRFTNPVGVTQDGGIFFWVGDDGRPEAAVQAFQMRGGTWVHDFSSLATSPIVAGSPSGPAWSPSRAGVELKPIPGAPKPADSAEGRLRQMHALARDFAVSDDFREQGWQALRPMPKPFARYGKPGSPLIDGAVFCFALGTDPEAYLILEARPGDSGPEWRYAFAPQTSYALKASWKGQEIWSLPNRLPRDATDTFYGRVYRPGE